MKKINLKKFYIYTQERLIMMNTPINAIQRQYTTAVNPVRFFETNNSKAAQKSTFDLLNQMYNNNSVSYNPFHPNVKTHSLAKNLDIMS